MNRVGRIFVTYCEHIPRSSSRGVRISHAFGSSDQFEQYEHTDDRGDACDVVVLVDERAAHYKTTLEYLVLYFLVRDYWYYFLSYFE